MPNKYIYVKGKRIYVTDEIYKAYKKQINHEAYLLKLDKTNKITSLDSNNIKSQHLIDPDVDVEKIIETKMRIEDLYKALDKLSDEERSIIESIYFNDDTIRELARKKNTSSKKILLFRDKVLRKLKELMKDW